MRRTPRPLFDRGEHAGCRAARAEDADRQIPWRLAKEREHAVVEAADVGVVADQLPGIVDPEGVHRADTLGERRQYVADVVHALFEWHGDVAGHTLLLQPFDNLLELGRFH